MNQDPATRDWPLPLWEHLGELRNRLLAGLGAVTLTAIPVFWFREAILTILLRHAGPASLSFIHPAEPLAAYMQLAGTLGLLGAMPVLVHQLWRFLRPGLRGREAHAILWTSIPGGILFYAGCSFGYMVVLPVAVRFLSAVAGPSLTPAVTIGNYVSFVSTFVLLFGLAFELPLVVGLLTSLGIITHNGLRAARRSVVVAIWAFAALLTPPDVVSQILMAVPMMVLFEISLLVARFLNREPQHDPNKGQMP